MPPNRPINGDSQSNPHANGSHHSDNNGNGNGLNQPKPRPATITHHSLPSSAHQTPTSIPYTTRAGWLHICERDRPVAEIFFSYYALDNMTPGQRPITFVFNGGPGASSAYLHVGALGPRRVAFLDNGVSPPPPARLTDNQETWLHFSDLVFVDPVGTGYSRALDTMHPHDDKKAGDQDLRQQRHEQFWSVKRDLSALGEFIQRFLTVHKRWSSPVFIAGESYGGYRVAKLARLLQEEYGVGLNGAIMVSPALEFSALEGDDYDISAWSDLLPTMAAAAHHHGRARVHHESLGAHVAAAEAFTRRQLVMALAMGDAMPEAERRHILRMAADLIGLHFDDVARAGGRIKMDTFCRLLLRDQQKFAGRYDASITARDPFPDRERYEGPDPTLWGLSRMFTPAIHMLLTEHLGVEDDREYHLINEDIFRAWSFEIEKSKEMKQGFLGATDDLRYGMASNPHMHVLISHGYFDLVTPYFSSNRLVDQMQLDSESAGRLTLKHFRGGHMFYAWRESREAFFETAKAFYHRAQTPQVI